MPRPMGKKRGLVRKRLADPLDWITSFLVELEFSRRFRPWPLALERPIKGKGSRLDDSVMLFRAETKFQRQQRLTLALCSKSRTVKGHSLAVWQFLIVV
jgi:hypothetical protein